jgi:2-amino-4-hydroxy-6-hydroxymethyldihydropteridine diphosphokinase
VTLAYVGIGSNLDGPLEHVNRAFDEISRLPHTRLLHRSSLYRSAPQGYAAQPDYVNAVAKLESSLAAPDLLAQLQRIEDAHGRQRSFANAPRTLDLDLLLYGTETVNSETLTLPHPRMHERAFVLEPLLELEPDLSIPGIGPAIACVEACSGQCVERIPAQRG